MRDEASALSAASGPCSSCRSVVIPISPGSTVRCSACGTENEPGRKFCGECGAKLLSACPSCGAANAPDMKFCGECGTSLRDATATARPAETVPAPAAAERRLVSVLF